MPPRTATRDASAILGTGVPSAPGSSHLPRPLTVLPDQVASRVVEVMGEPLLRERLVELGFTNGQSVTVLSRAPGGGPLRVGLRGSAIGLRREEAACVFVAAPAGDAK